MLSQKKYFFAKTMSGIATLHAASQLRLGTIGLAAKDVAYIRALLRLYTHTAKLAWVLVDQPPYQAVVTDRAARAGDPAWFAQFTGAVLTLVEPPGAPEDDTVAYPVHAEQLRTWLARRQQDLHAPASRTAPAPAPAAAPNVTASAPTAAAAAAVPAAVGERRFKLRRWPSPALLQGDPSHLKIATLLSRNALGVARLAALTGQSEDACRRFVATLHGAGLLVESVASGSTPGHANAPAAPAAAPVRAGLLASLRRHLGL